MWQAYQVVFIRVCDVGQNATENLKKYSVSSIVMLWVCLILCALDIQGTARVVSCTVDTMYIRMGVRRLNYINNTTWEQKRREMEQTRDKCCSDWRENERGGSSREWVGLLASSTNLHAIVWPWQVFRRLKRSKQDSYTLFQPVPSPPSAHYINRFWCHCISFRPEAANRKIKLFIWTSRRFIDTENNLRRRFK